jgi:hypothetical protein
MNYWVKGPLTVYPARLYRSVGAARRARDRMDLEYGSAAHVVVCQPIGVSSLLAWQE